VLEDGSAVGCWVVVQDGAEMVAACAPGGLGVEEVVRLGEDLGGERRGEGGEGGGGVLED